VFFGIEEEIQTTELAWAKLIMGDVEILWGIIHNFLILTYNWGV